MFWKVYLKLVTNASLTAVVPQISYVFVPRPLRRSDLLVSKHKLTGGQVYHSQRFIHIPGWIWSCLSNPEMRRMVGQWELASSNASVGSTQSPGLLPGCWRVQHSLGKLLWGMLALPLLDTVN